MIVVDDHLALARLAGVVTAADLGDDTVATTSLWYLRLVSAVTAPTTVRGPGRLRRVLDGAPDPAALLRGVLEPSRSTLVVLHPMEFALETARAQREHRLNLLQEETLGAAIHHGAGIRLAGPNAGGPLERAALQAGVDCQVVVGGGQA